MKKIFGAMMISVVSLTLLAGCHTHAYQKGETHLPTCAEGGYTTYLCPDCGESYPSDFTQPYGHQGEVTKQGYDATCLLTGKKDEIMCKVCGQVIQSQTEIPANGHSIQVTKEGIEATCLEAGLSEEQYCSVCNTVVQEQTEISPLGHIDSDRNNLCDRCKIPYGENVKHVYTVEDLKNISNDLNGVYQLEADISLSGMDWVALGQANAPFAGYLYGNNHSISGLSVTNKEIGGLFAYNSGTIDGVVLKNVTVSISNMNAQVGGLAAYNRGTIKNCRLDGTNTLINSVYYYQETSWPSYDGGSVAYTGIYGGICAVNEGMVSDCILTTSFNCQYTNTAEFKLNHSILGYIAGGDDMQATSSFYFGGIAGQNKKQISNCIIQGVNTNLINVDARILKKYGLAIANSYAYIGAIVGENISSIGDCRAKQSTVTQSVSNPKFTDTLGGGYGAKCHLALYNDTTYTGVIGKNSGSVFNTFYE